MPSTSRLLAIFLLLICPAGATIITQAPANFVLDGGIDEWRDQPQTFPLPNAIKSSIWFAQTANGLVVAGAVDRKFPFARTQRELTDGGALEIVLSFVDAVELPDLPYDPSNCTKAPDGRAKAACAAWFERQRVYRGALERQFIRAWRVAPVGAREEFALPAYGLFTDAERKKLPFARPDGTPSFRFREVGEQVTFEVLIPWSILPPADRLNLDQLRVKAELITSSSLQWMVDTRKLPLATVFPPVVTRITTCGQPLAPVSVTYEDDAPAFYMPVASLQVDKIFFFTNALTYYREQIPRGDESSPYVGSRSFDTRELDPGEFLCGPYLSYRKGSTVRHYPFVLPDLQRLTVKRLPSGSRFLIDGPVNTPIDGARRAVSTINLRIYTLDSKFVVNQVLNVGTIYEYSTGYEIEISPDFMKVKEFRQAEMTDSWSSETFCFSGKVYSSCAKEAKSAPPAKRVLTEEDHY